MSAALPLAGESPAELCIARLRSMFAKKPADRGLCFWSLLSTEERRFVLRLARLDPDKAAGEWRALSIDERDAVQAKWRGLRELVDRVELGLRHAR